MKNYQVFVLFFIIIVVLLIPGSIGYTDSQTITINELAWMGTATSTDDEWIELYNSTAGDIDLTGWSLAAGDGSPSIPLSGSIPAGGYYLLERTDDDSVPTVLADITYTGAMSNDGENLVLRDGAAVIVDQVDCSTGWFSGHADGRVPMVRVAAGWTYNPRCGTPTNSAGISYSCTLTTTYVGSDLDYAVYFNLLATTATETTLEHTEMEDALLSFIGNATGTIDVAIYGLNRQSLIDALIAAHDKPNVTVRVVGDDDAAAGSYSAGYQALLDAGIGVVTDTSSYIEHNKFAVFDSDTVWTGSTNWTSTGFTMNANNSIVISDTTLAGIYLAEFEEMWAGDFHKDKLDDSPHLLDYNGTLLEVYFSPSDLVAFEVWDALAGADDTLHFAMFFWTDTLLADRAIERLDAGAEIWGVWDQLGAANAYSVDEALVAAGAEIRIEDFPGKVHHKFGVIDVQGSDPVVVLGSYNWTGAGAWDNDENTLIIHDAALAQAYYTEWLRLWDALGDKFVFMPVVIRNYPKATNTPVPVNTPTTVPVNTPTTAPADVEIMHIEYNPDGDDVQGEYVRIENQGGSVADMTGWMLSDAANHDYTFPAFSLSAGASVQVWVKSGTDTASDLYWGSGAAIWNNTGDTATLRDSGGGVIDSYSY